MGNRRRRRRPLPIAGLPSGSFLERLSVASLLFLGLVIGLAGGLYYTWVVAPIAYIDASPARLSEPYKAEYIFLVSQSYAANEDWDQAERRLSALDDPAIGQRVSSLLETYLREQKSANEIRNLAILAQNLGIEGGVVALFAPTPLPGAESNVLPTATIPLPPTLTATVTRLPTQTPLPTLTPTPAPLPSPTAPLRYRLLSQQRVCQPGQSASRIEVITQDALLNPYPGVEVLVSWDGGEDRFYTGFKPERGPGYGDFTMSPDVSYTVMLVDGSLEVSGLRIEPCSNGLDGGWQLVFQNLLIRLTRTPEP